MRMRAGGFRSFCMGGGSGGGWAQRGEVAGLSPVAGLSAKPHICGNVARLQGTIIELTH